MSITEKPASSAGGEVDPAKEWHKTACILCSLNCGVEVRLDDREITRVRGNKAHVASKGYTCEKALRLNHYQNAAGRLTSPLKRLDDGTYIEIDWDTAIEEVAAALLAARDTHGGDKIMYYGGGGQGNHLVGVYGQGLRNSLGITRKSNALAQEKTGEAWVEGRMYGTHTHGEFDEADVSIFLGKNPWQSHGFDETRRVLKEIANSDDRSMIVIDVRRTETADLADHFLAVTPGGDAFLLAAILGVIVEEGLMATDWLAENVVGYEAAIDAFAAIPVASFAEKSGVDEEQIRDAARRIGRAESVSVFEDLGTQMAPHSTLISYLQRAITTLVGSYGKPGAMTAHSAFVPIFSYGATGKEPLDPVEGGAIISGLIACNDVAPGIVSDHPDRSRALFIESANPVHSLADSAKFREAMRAVDVSVVIDVAMTETAQEADYVLPAASQYEKAETTFFGASFPENKVTMRAPILEPLEGSLPEAEIHSRLAKAMGFVTEADLEPLREAAAESYDAFAAAYMAAAADKPALGAVGAVVLYETIGPTLPEGMAMAAPMWFSCQQLAMRYTDSVRAAGFEGEDAELGNAVFDALIESRDGIIFTRHEHGDGWNLLRTPDQKIHLEIPEMLSELAALTSAEALLTTDEFPYVLAAGERRSFTANTIMRDPGWRKKDMEGALRMSPDDAKSLDAATGDRIRVTTAGGSAVAVLEVNSTMQDGHISLPNGLGVGYAPAGGEQELTGVAPNELTTSDWKDPIAGTPWHKHVPARLEKVP